MIKQLLASEIKGETSNTRQVLSRFTDEHLNWRPHEKSMTVGELAAHVVELHGWLAFVVERDAFDFHKDYQRIEVKSMAQLLGLLDEGLERNLALLNGADDVDWMKDWSLKAGDHVISSSAKGKAMRFIVMNHLVHHRGQLSVYLRMLDLPVPGVYGPSADDK